MRHVSLRRTVVTLAVFALLMTAACSSNSGGTKHTKKLSVSGTLLTISGKAQFQGDLTKLISDASALDPIVPPFTVTVADPGRGGLELRGVLVNGAEKDIVWSGGRPLPVTGSCTLDAGEVGINVAPDGLVVSLDGAVRAFTAGTCRFGSSVAVGAKGLASSVDSVQFTVPGDTNFTTSGAALVHLTAPRRYEGRQGQTSFEGPMRITTEQNGNVRASKVMLDKGTWVATVTISVDGKVLHVVGDLEGDFTILEA